MFCNLRLFRPLAVFMLFSISKISSAQQQPPPNGVKILVAGDSISHGFEYDYTWRYRLWEWFRHEHTTNAATTPALTFVGPYNGTNPNLTAAEDGTDPSLPRVWGAYHAGVDPAFSPNGGSQHFALSGRPAWFDVELLPPQLATFDPDLVIVHMGFNDFGWWRVMPEELVETMRKLTELARAQRPDVVVLIADVSGRLLMKGREDIEPKTVAYNKLLREQLPAWSRPESPVLLVPVSEVYDCHVDICPAGIDGLHPNSLGEFQIARAYTQVMHEHFGWGTGPLIIPPVDVIMAGSEASGAAEDDGDDTVSNTGNSQLKQGNKPAWVWVAVAVGVSVGVCLIVAAVAYALLSRAKKRRGAGLNFVMYTPVPMEEAQMSP